MRVKLPSLTSGLEETSEAEGVDYTFPFSVLIRLRRLEPAHAQHNQNELCFCSRLLAAFTFLFSPFRLLYPPQHQCLHHILDNLQACGFAMMLLGVP